MRYHLIAILVSVLLIASCSPKGPTVAEIETDFGTMRVELYDSTPLHRDNFVKLASEGYYDGTLFHRVISGFMIQGGDPDSRDAAPSARLGVGGPGYKIDAEIGSPHFKGTLAAARQGAGNPEKRSSGSQFYVVQGTPVTDDYLTSIENQKGIKYSQAQRDKYKKIGGTPQLDADYTVFGEVIEGLDVIDKIARVQTGTADRPVEDVTMTVRIIN